MSFLDYHDRDDTGNTNVMQQHVPITDVTSFAQRLKDARKKLGLSQAALGEKAGMSQSAIANFEAGTREQPRNLLTLAKALEVSPHWLESGKEMADKGEPLDTTVQKNSKTSVFNVEDGSDPMHSMPTIGATLAHLGALMAALTPMGRKSIAPLLASIADDPDTAVSASKMADAIASSLHHEMKNADVARALGLGHSQPVETGPAPLPER